MALKHPKRGGERSFAAKPHHIFRPNFVHQTPSPASVLSHKAAHMLDNLAAQYNGVNNGDLSAAPTIMALFGWTSQGFGGFSTVHRDARMGSNPKTGETVSLPRRRTLHFKPGLNLRDKVNASAFQNKVIKDV
jgi:hypothetical protein